MPPLRRCWTRGGRSQDKRLRTSTTRWLCRDNFGRPTQSWTAPSISAIGPQRFHPIGSGWSSSSESTNGWPTRFCQRRLRGGGRGEGRLLELAEPRSAGCHKIRSINSGHVRIVAQTPAGIRGNMSCQSASTRRGRRYLEGHSLCRRVRPATIGSASTKRTSVTSSPRAGRRLRLRDTN